MAVTRDGIPVRCWTFAGSESDQRIIRTVKDDLGAWQLRRLVWVADAGFACAANRAYLTRGGGHDIHAEKLRHTGAEAAAALARPGRYHDVADNLRVIPEGAGPVKTHGCVVLAHFASFLVLAGRVEVGVGVKARAEPDRVAAAGP